MATGPHYKVPFRRRREGRTDYRQRLRLLFSKKPRAVVRKTNNNTKIQLVALKPEGDEILVVAESTALNKFGYSAHTGNIPAAYLTGMLFGYKALAAGYEDAVLDMGLHRSTKGNRIYAALKGMVDAGLDVPHNSSIFPSDETISGAVIDEYRGTDMVSQVEAAKEKIVQEFGGEEA